MADEASESDSSGREETPRHASEEHDRDPDGAW